MDLRVILSIGLILSGSMLICQCRFMDDDEEQDKMLFEDRNFDLAARDEQYSDDESLLKRLIFKARQGQVIIGTPIGSPKQPCTEELQNTVIPTPDLAGGNFQTAQQCKAWCDTTPSCISWNYFTVPHFNIPPGACYLKTTPRSQNAQTSQAGVIAGFCDNQQQNVIIGKPIVQPVLPPVVKSPCVEVLQNTHQMATNIGPSKQVSSVQQCQAYCDSLPKCNSWDYYPKTGYGYAAGSCFPKSGNRAAKTAQPRTGVLAGYCDKQQTNHG